MSRPTPEHVRREAERAFDSAVVADPLLSGHGRLGDPVPVLGPDGSEAGWFVPVTVGSKLGGFLQFDAHVRLLRWSAFPHGPNSTDEWPDQQSWLDRDVIARRAKAMVPDGVRAGTPVLTYDQHVTRLAWMVLMRKPDGTNVAVHVAGEYAYLPASGAPGTT